ncbi:MAG: DNA translocase FtsK 4TM domain-containing protein [Sporomusaceae bacterium]|nr:DNA translocase FtsK 4TM domain-containing protein [Sporomusaceae bacterium]
MSKRLPSLSADTRDELRGILLIAAGLFAIICLYSSNVGSVGAVTARVLRYAFGAGAPLLPLLTVIVGSRYLASRRQFAYSIRFWSFLALYGLGLALFHHSLIPAGQEILPENLIPGGGLVGGMLLFIARNLFGYYGALIVLLAFSLCFLLLCTTWSLSRTISLAREKASESVDRARESLAASWQEAQAEDETEFFDQEKWERERPAERPLPLKAVEPAAAPAPDKREEEPVAVINELPMSGDRQYIVPPLSLLAKNTKPRSLKMQRELQDNSRLLEETLANFGVGAKIVNTCQGPTVTRYEIEPAPGVKVSKIVNLADDIALKLAASGVRIEAPIPGKAAIGIEVPNKETASVPLRDVLESEPFQKASSPLTVALGKDIAGQPIIADLAKMPHVLVAGATGSGKSVCINTLITSVLFKATPEQVKFILIDPKVVELSNYNGIPHLMTEVVTDPKRAASTLRWAVQEMERRYALFASASVRDIGRYNELNPELFLPLVVIIIDELADLMMVSPVDVEDAICRLAQMARAAGLHLVLATQRPSVDVITGTIKANIPSRISFAVSSQIDSRTILDMAGAEKLIGKGDMLYSPQGSNKPVRVQGAFISDNEVEELMSFIRKQGEPVYNEEIPAFEPVMAEQEGNHSFEDEMLEEAVRMVLETGQASVSMLQRKFRIGYTRAARLIDTMEEMKIVGPNVGSKAREIIMTSDQVYTKYFKQ